MLGELQVKYLNLLPFSQLVTNITTHPPTPFGNSSDLLGLKNSAHQAALVPESLKLPLKSVGPGMEADLRVSL